jgi:hypothetical protein
MRALSVQKFLHIKLLDCIKGFLPFTEGGSCKFTYGKQTKTMLKLVRGEVPNTVPNHLKTSYLDCTRCNFSTIYRMLFLRPDSESS